MKEPGQLAYGEYETNRTWASLTDRERRMWAEIEEAVRADERAKPIPGPLDEVFPSPANKGVKLGVDNDNA